MQTYTISWGTKDGTDYQIPQSVSEAMSDWAKAAGDLMASKVMRDLSAAMYRGSYDSNTYSWKTTLWERHNKPYLSRRVDMLQRQMRTAQGPKSAHRVELEMMRVGDAMRRLKVCGIQPN